MTNNTKQTIKAKYLNQFGRGKSEIPLLNFDPSSIGNNDFTLAQTILAIKMYVYEELEKLDKDEYRYRNGFSESSVNQLMYFAYLRGMSDAERGMTPVIRGKMIEELQDKLKDVMDMLDLVPFNQTY